MKLKENLYSGEDCAQISVSVWNSTLNLVKSLLSPQKQLYLGYYSNTGVFTAFRYSPPFPGAG